MSTGDDHELKIITYYNYMVDVVDKIRATYKMARNLQRWPMVILNTMVKTSGINSQIIYLGNTNKKNFKKRNFKTIITRAGVG